LAASTLLCRGLGTRGRASPTSAAAISPVRRQGKQTGNDERRGERMRPSQQILSHRRQMLFYLYKQYTIF
jgi:hypothetical protein